MSNGEQCCALEICCNFAEMMARLPAKIAAFTGMDEKDCLAFLRRMEAAHLTFAPKTFDLVAKDLKATQLSGPSPIGEYVELNKWMEHESLTFAPKSFQPVIRDIVRATKKRNS